jgi:hypothetical protein
LRTKALKSVLDVTWAVFPAAFGHFGLQSMRALCESRAKCGEKVTAISHGVRH